MKLRQRTFPGAVLRVALALAVTAALGLAVYRAVSPHLPKPAPAVKPGPSVAPALDPTVRELYARRLQDAIDQARAIADRNELLRPAFLALQRQDLQDIIAGLVADTPKAAIEHRLLQRVQSERRDLTGQMNGEGPGLDELLHLQERLLRGHISPADTLQVSRICASVPSGDHRQLINRLHELRRALRCLGVYQYPEPTEGVFGASPWHLTTSYFPRDQVPRSMDLDEANDAAAAATRYFPESDAGYKIDSIADLDGDGIYEVAVQDSVTGNAGHYFYGFFWLGRDRLIPIPTDPDVFGDPGGASFSPVIVGVSYHFLIWAPGDPHCCPSYRGRRTYIYRPLRAFIEVDCDTIPFPEIDPDAHYHEQARPAAGRAHLTHSGEPPRPPMVLPVRSPSQLEFGFDQTIATEDWPHPHSIAFAARRNLKTDLVHGSRTIQTSCVV